MFGISIYELLIVAVLLITFVKPSEIPTITRSIGQFLRKINGYISEIKDSFSEAADDLPSIDKRADGKYIKGEDGKTYWAYNDNEK